MQPAPFSDVLGHFDIQAEDLEPWAERLQPQIRSFLSRWVSIYLLWLHRVIQSSWFGEKRVEAVAALVRSGMPSDQWEALELWFRMLDDARVRSAESRTRFNTPKELFEAYFLLCNDPLSPYFDVMDIPEDVMFPLAEVLGEIREAALPAIEEFLRSLGPRQH